METLESGTNELREEVDSVVRLAKIVEVPGQGVFSSTKSNIQDQDAPATKLVRGEGPRRAGPDDDDVSGGLESGEATVL